MGIKYAAKIGLLQMMEDMDAKNPAKYARDHFWEQFWNFINRIELCNSKTRISASHQKSSQ